MHSQLEKVELQNIRHQLLSYAPRLDFILQSSANETINHFLKWAHDQSVSMDWLLHIRLLNWLKQQAIFHIDAQLIKDMLGAAALRWSINGLDHLPVKGILLTSHLLPNEGIGLWKNQAAHESHHIVSLKLAKHFSDGYAISYQYGSWGNIKWQPI